jgi:hypothetical protein
MTIHSNPTELARALGKANKKITAVTYDYPGFWTIRTAQDTYLLGDAGGVIGWNIETGALGDELPNSDENTNPAPIAKAFSAWLDKVEAN